jgi:probable F420-dependent oxidoreductase
MDRIGLVLSSLSSSFRAGKIPIGTYWVGGSVRDLMKFSLAMFGRLPKDYADVARVADEVGFEGLWLGDHLVTPSRFETKYPYRSSGDPGYQSSTPWPDVWVTFGHLAAITNRLYLGTGVYLVPLRNPFVTARAVATAQLISDGRIWFGIGVGWMKEEFEAVGETFAGRGSRTDEILEILQKLWTGEVVEHRGRWYEFGPVQMSPALSRPPLIVVGGTSQAALDRAASYGDAWHAPSTSTLEQSVEWREDIIRRLQEKGRDSANFHFFARLNTISDHLIQRALEFGLDDLVIPVPPSLSTLEERISWVQSLNDQLPLRK